MADETGRNNRYFDGKIFRDEPIRRPVVARKQFLPQKYIEMKRIASRYDAYRQSEEWLFYNQAKFMENFEDDYEFTGHFERYFPTYRMMTDAELRGYFSWRTRVRRGQIEPTCLSFAFVYIYELLNGIGVKSSEDGFKKLYDFWTVYRVIDDQIDRYMERWLMDYAIFNGLDKSLFEEFSDTEYDKSLMTLLNYTSRSEDEIFSALMFLSSYHTEQSKFYKDYPEDYKSVACRVFAGLEEYYLKNRKTGFLDRLFGKKIISSYYMFGSAVFYGRMSHKNTDYVVNDIHRYLCRDGRWICERIFRDKGKNKELGLVLKTIDSRMREKYHYRYSMKLENPTKMLLGIVDKSIDEFLKFKKENEKPKIEIDLSKLQGIRDASSVTRDKLIVDEEVLPESNLTQVNDMVAAEDASQVETSISDETDLSGGSEESSEKPLPIHAELSFGMALNELQTRFLRCLLSGEPYSTFLREHGIILSVIVDEINEALYDEFGDTVIDWAGDSPELIEDYIEDLRNMIG